MKSKEIKILLAAPRGFCAGVERAIEIVKKSIDKYGAPVYVRHEIVHNKHVVDSLKKIGAIFVEEINEIKDKTRPVIFSAHGVPKKVPVEAENFKMEYVDATLNAGGIRFGTAELYRVVENIDNIIECVAVEHSLYNDTEVVLFIKMQPQFNLNEDLIKFIKFEIKSNLSPKHVPRRIFQVKDIPKTKSGKIVELTIKKIINGLDVRSKNTLANPDCLKEFENIYKEIKN